MAVSFTLIAMSNLWAIDGDGVYQSDR